jgi:hypothetical protein
MVIAGSLANAQNQTRRKLRRVANRYVSHALADLKKRAQRIFLNQFAGVFSIKFLKIYLPFFQIKIASLFFRSAKANRYL